MEGNIATRHTQVTGGVAHFGPDVRPKGKLRIPRGFWPVCAFAFLLLFRLDAAPLYILDEVKNAQCAREMMQRGDAIVPTFNGELRTDKPVLHYLFMMAAYSVFGFSPFSARIFSAIFGIACLILVYLFTKRRMDKRTASHVAWALVLSTHWAFEFRLSVPDPYLIFYSTAGLLCGFSWIEGHGRGYLFPMSLSLALAVLSKGPVAILIPGLCLFAWAAMRGFRVAFRAADLAVATLLFLLVALPWYVAVHKYTDGAWTEGFFIRHNIGRFSKPMEGHKGFFALPLLLLGAGMLPASAMAVEAYRMRTRLFADPFLKFSLTVVVMHLLVFGISATKLPNYAMPAYPFAAVILGRCVLISTAEGGPGLPGYVEMTSLTILGLLPAVGCIALANEPGLGEIRWMPLWLLAPPILSSLLILIRRTAREMPSLLPLAAGWLSLNILGLHLVYPTVYSRNPVSLTAEQVKAASSVAAYGVYNPAFNILLEAPIPRFHNSDSLSAWLDANPGALVVTRKTAVDSLMGCGLKVTEEHRDLFEKPTTVVLSR